MAKRKTHTYVHKKHNLNGSITKTVTRSRKTISGKTRSHTHVTRSKPSDNKGSCSGFLYLILFLALVGLIIKIFKEAKDFVSENPYIVFIIVFFIVLIVVLFIIKKTGFHLHIKAENECSVKEVHNGAKKLLESQQAEVQQQMYREQPVQQPVPADGCRSSFSADVPRWHEEMSARQAIASPEQAQQQSRIFGQKSPENLEPAQPQMSRLFGQKKQDNDILVEANSAAIWKAQQEAMDANKRRTVNVMPVQSAPTEHRQESFDWMPTPYNFPLVTDLTRPTESEKNDAIDELHSRKLEETLEGFNIQVRVVHVCHGPLITRFEIEVASGIRYRDIENLEREIAGALEATTINIIVPIPGKSLVGIEIPNRKVSTVTLREVLQNENMQTAKSPLTVALGKDIAGTPILCDLANMPHMLIAGQTGSGKSVCINAIINSLLYRTSPDEVKLILIDTKVIELQFYNGIPHLLLPVVNDPNKAVAALAYAIFEMNKRYSIFTKRKVQNIDDFNYNLKKGEKPMSRIVIIIDEIAELIANYKDETEKYVGQLSKYGHSAGIHLVISTQRPSASMLSGYIKANIPCRIAFRTVNSAESQIILGQNGAEKLVCPGNMLYLPANADKAMCIQGCYLSNDEIRRITKHVRDTNPSTYDPDVLEKLEQIENGNVGDMSWTDLIGDTGEIGESDGGLFEQAVEFAISDGQISTSTLQRRLKIGYARAGRLADEMEVRGIVAAKDGSKPRKCLITREEWEEIKRNTTWE